MRIGSREFDPIHQVYIMGILNVTPDSFSDGGRYLDLDKALYHAQEMVEQGVDILDIGGESTRPGYQKVSEAEEIERVAPVLEKLKARFDVPLSIDTYKTRVAEAAITAGADLVNDIWGLKAQNGLAELIAHSGVSCCLMHNRDESNYSDFLSEVEEDLRQSLSLAEQAGIEKGRIILDPGIGFGKTFQQNLIMLNNLHRLGGLGYPVLLGASRKSVIGLALDLPAAERLEGTLATTVMAVMQGCGFVRVHDVKENKRAAAMALAVRESGR